MHLYKLDNLEECLQLGLGMKLKQGKCCILGEGEDSALADGLSLVEPFYSMPASALSFDCFSDNFRHGHFLSGSPKR